MSVRLSAPRTRGGMLPVDRVLLRRRASRALDAIEHARSELSISLVDDDAMAHLNSVHRGVARPTDVLSFSLLEGGATAHRGPLLGDVVIALGVAQAQARRGRRSLDDELARLLIHGVLHLIGHDHGRVQEALAMRREERRLWRAVCAGGTTRGGLTLTRPPIAVRAPRGAKAAKTATAARRSRTTSRHA